MTTPPPLIRLSGVTKHYGSGASRVEALRGVDLEIPGGQVATLVGKSGSGKSTLLNVIGCIVEPSGGRIELGGEVVADGGWTLRDYTALRLRRIGFIFQFHNLVPFLTCLENIQLVLRHAGVDRRAGRERAMELLEYFDVGHRRDRYPSEVSGGEAQRVAIARALANRPSIILADEPTASLDATRANKAVDLLRKVAAEQHAAVIIVTHDQQVMNRADHTFMIDEGRIHGGSSEDLYYAGFRSQRRAGRAGRGVAPGNDQPAGGA